MTARRKNALGILLSIALGLVVMKSCAGGEVRQARRVGRALAKPVRAQGRADAGYPVLQIGKYAVGTVYYGARALATIGLIL